MSKKLKYSFGCLLLSLGLQACKYPGQESCPEKAMNSDVIYVYPKVCKNGLQEGPGRQFGVFVFCDDAVGTTIGIIKISPGSGVQDETGKWVDHVWSLHDRFWQEPEWARDVLSVKWTKRGLGVIVETQPIYGTGKRYVLDLVQRKITNESGDL